MRGKCFRVLLLFFVLASLFSKKVFAEDSGVFFTEKNSTPDYPLQENNTLDYSLQKNSTLDYSLQENNTFDYPLQENSTLDYSLEENSAFDYSLEENPYISPEEMKGEKGIFFPEKLYAILTDAFTKGIRSVSKGLSLTLSLLVIASLFKTTKSISENSALNNTYDYFSVILVSLSSYSITAQVFETSKKALDGLTTYFAALMPIMTSLQLAGGNTAVASSSASTLIMFISAVEIISDKVLITLLGIAFALAIISALPSTVNLRSVSSLIKNTVSVILAFLFSMFGFVMIFQTAVAAAADNAAIRSLKFASGVFIPVIGNMLGENIKSVITAVGTVKATIGAIGAVAIFSIILPPIVYTVLYKLSILLCAIIARVLGLEKESDFLYEINSLFNILVAIMCGIGMLFIISVAVFAKTTVNAS